MAPLVDIRDVRYAYGGASRDALRGVSLQLEHGLHVVAGPSGGGKSTLLRLCNGIVPHLHGGRLSGAVATGGVDVLRTVPRRMAATVGLVVQDVERQAVHTTVERDIAFGLENLAVPRDEMRDRVHDVAERLGIAHLLPRSIATLSGGERQRVAVAGALVLRPALLVLDEPLSQLDATGSRALLALLLQLRDGGTSILASEHGLDGLLPVADSLVVVDDGRVRGPAPPAALASQLDTAPQVVRLCAALGVNPPLLDPSLLPWPPFRPAVVPTAAPHGDVAWSLRDVSGGPGNGLQHVDAAGAGGEVVAVMGDNGSGKTTLLRLIAGVVAPRDGAATRSGRVAYLPQNPAALLHRASIRAEIAWTERAAGHHDGHAIAAALGLRDLDADPRDLSSGQRQRAAIAAVLAGRPSVALLDEPTRGMDGRSREALAATVRELAAGGGSLVIATHDAELVASVADRVLVVADGAVSDMGSPSRALVGDSRFATQLGRFGAVTVDDAATLLDGRLRAVAGADR